MRAKTTEQVTIAAGTALSNAVNLGDKTLSAIVIPAAWSTAALSFQASDDGGATWHDHFDWLGNEISAASADVVAGRRIAVDPSSFRDVDMIKLRSGLTASPVNQGTACVLTLIARKYYALD
jgi:hypothetical protein